MSSQEEIPERQESDPPSEFGPSTRRSFISGSGCLAWWQRPDRL
jgi:hypothetical protein